MVKLYEHQLDALKKICNGCILNGGVGSGKSITSLAYYYMQNGGSITSLKGGHHIPMKNPKDLYIITTARKRDTKEWEGELANFVLSTHPEAKCDICKLDLKTFKQLGLLIAKVNKNLSDGKYADVQYTTASIDNLRTALVDAGAVRGKASGNGWYANGDAVTLKVTPSMGYSFSRWTTDAFLLCNSVEKIIVPSTVTTIHTNAFSGAGNLKDVVLASSDTKIEDSNENVDKKDTDENGKSNPSDATDNKNGDNSENKDAGNANPSGTSNNQTKEQSGANNNQSNYKVTVDSSVDTAAEEKKLAEQYKKENKTDDGATAQNRGTEKQSGGTEIAGIDEGIDADENTIGSNADIVSEKAQSMPMWGIILIVVVAAIAVSGTVLFIRKKRKQK